MAPPIGWPTWRDLGCPHHTMDWGKSLHFSEPQRKPYILMQQTEKVSRGGKGRKSVAEAAASGESPGEEVPGGRLPVPRGNFLWEKVTHWLRLELNMSPQRSITPQSGPLLTPCHGGGA